MKHNIIVYKMSNVIAKKNIFHQFQRLKNKMYGFFIWTI